jgi:hypothetical protein
VAWTPRDSILPPEWQAAGTMLEVARHMRERSNVLTPTLIWTSQDGTSGYTMIPHAVGGMPDALDQMLTALDDEYGPPAWFAIILDAYGRIADAEHEPDLRPEDLGDLFTMGDEAVVEQLVLVIAAEDRITSWRQVYRYTPVDGWEWENPQFMANPVLNQNLMTVVLRHTDGIHHNGEAGPG